MPDILYTANGVEHGSLRDRQHLRRMDLSQCIIGDQARAGVVESRMGAVAWGLWPSPRFPSPLIKPDVPISGIRLSGWLHREARDGAARGKRWRHRTPSSR